jgi:hypothetical protein
VEDEISIPHHTEDTMSTEITGALGDLKALIANLSDEDIVELMAALPTQESPVAVASLATDESVLDRTILEAGCGMAKGGRNYLTAESASAITTVIETGRPVVVPAAKERGNERRGVTHLVYWRTASGNVAMHPLYTKE